MTEKLTSAEAYEHFKTAEFVSVPDGYFDRIDIERHLKKAGEIHDFIPPSGKSFLDWARREGLVETVSRGTYQWTTVTEAEAAEVGRKLAESVKADVTDVYPGIPMMLPESQEKATTTVDIHTEAKRISRRDKKRLKATFLSSPDIRKVILHCGTTPSEAFEATR